jgi:D-sedoheptulose 7-phosphate isomerase
MPNEFEFNFMSYVIEQHRLLSELSPKTIEEFVNTFQELRSNGGTLWILGNGGSAGTASHLVTDFSKGSNENGNGSLRAMAPSEFISLQTAIANDLDFSQVFSKFLEMYSKSGDAILVISVSGRSPNLVSAAQFAAKQGMKVLSIVGERGYPLQSISQSCIMIKSNDYQIVENIQLTLGHWFMKKLRISSECTTDL